MRNAPPFSLKTTTHIPSFIGGDLLSNRGRIIRLCRLNLFYALVCSIQLHFAVDRKPLVTSYPARCSGCRSSQDVLVNLAVLGQMALKIFIPLTSYSINQSINKSFVVPPRTYAANTLTPGIPVLSQPLELSPAVSCFFDVCFQIAAY